MYGAAGTYIQVVQPSQSAQHQALARLEDEGSRFELLLGQS